jgi:serine/threonine protein kinase
MKFLKLLYKKKYTKTRLLYKTLYNEIYEGVYKNKECIIKILPNNRYSRKELDILYRLKNDHGYSQLIDHEMKPNQISIIMKKYDVDLFNVIVQPSKYDITEQYINKFLVDISSSLLRFREHYGYFHSDVKPANIFIEDDNSFILGDFDMSIKYTNNNIIEECGTDKYIAPEIAYYKYAHKKSDVWSLGITLGFMLSRQKLPDIHDKSGCLSHPGVIDHLCKYNIPDIYIDLIKLMLVPEPDERIDFIDIIKLIK